MRLVPHGGQNARGFGGGPVQWGIWVSGCRRRSLCGQKRGKEPPCALMCSGSVLPCMPGATFKTSCIATVRQRIVNIYFANISARERVNPVLTDGCRPVSPSNFLGGASNLLEKCHKINGTCFEHLFSVLGFDGTS